MTKLFSHDYNITIIIILGTCVLIKLFVFILKVGTYINFNCCFGQY